jgi:quercetin dioxygenase-like cupin family protein
MREGEVHQVSPSETITCVRSGLNGGSFVFDFELAPGAKGPPMHTHDEGDEIIEVTQGEIVFRVEGEDRHLQGGDVLTLTPDEPHTFWNPSRTQTVKCRVTHGARFERLIAQPGLMHILMYMAFVDPGSSRPANRVVRVFVRMIAWAGRLMGVRPVIDVVA